MAIIYVTASVGGVILSAVLLAGEVSAGSSGAVCALVCLGIVELVQLWPLISRPW